VNLKGETAGGILGGGSLTANFDNCYFTGKLNAATAGLGNGIVGNFWATNWSIVRSKPHQECRHIHPADNPPE